VRRGSIGVPSSCVAADTARTARPSHAISCRAACKLPACMDHANWTARRAANRDPAVGIVARSARRVVPTAAGLRSPSGDCFGPELRASLRPIAAHRGNCHWPGPSPARVRSASLVPFQAQVRSSKLGPVAPPTERALQDIIAEGAFLEHTSCQVCQGGLETI
jgi:hypothetical protein